MYSEKMTSEIGQKMAECDVQAGHPVGLRFAGRDIKDAICREIAAEHAAQARQIERLRAALQSIQSACYPRSEDIAAKCGDIARAALEEPQGEPE